MGKGGPDGADVASGTDAINAATMNVAVLVAIMVMPRPLHLETSSEDHARTAHVLRYSSRDRIAEEENGPEVMLGQPSDPGGPG